MSFYDDLPTTDDVPSWTLDECSAYAAMRDESYGEMSAEAGMGAMSLGYGVEGAYAAAGSVTHPTADPLYVAAKARLKEAREAAAPAPAPVATDFGDDLPW